MDLHLSLRTYIHKMLHVPVVRPRGRGESLTQLIFSDRLGVKTESVNYSPADSFQPVIKHSGTVRRGLTELLNLNYS